MRNKWQFEIALLQMLDNRELVIYRYFLQSDYLVTFILAVCFTQKDKQTCNKWRPPALKKYNMIYLSTAIWLTPGGPKVHIYTQTIHRTTQITTQQLK